MLFRNRSVQVKFVKDQKAATDVTDESAVIANIEAAAAYAEIFKDVVTHTALVIGGAFIVCKIVERICR